MYTKEPYTTLQCHFMQSHIRRVHVLTSRTFCVHQRTMHQFTVSLQAKPHTKGACVNNPHVLCTPKNYTTVYSVTSCKATYVGCMCYHLARSVYTKELYTSLQCHFMQSHIRRVHVLTSRTFCVHQRTMHQFTVSLHAKPHT